MQRRYVLDARSKKTLGWVGLVSAIAISVAVTVALLVPCNQCNSMPGFYLNFENSDYVDHLRLLKIDPFASAQVDDLSVYSGPCETCTGGQSSTTFSKALSFDGSGTFMIDFPAEPAPTIAGVKIGIDVIVPVLDHDITMYIGDGDNGIVVKLISGYWYIVHVKDESLYTDQIFTSTMDAVLSPSGTGVNHFEFQFLSGESFSVLYNGQAVIGMNTGGKNEWHVQSQPSSFETFSFYTISASTFVTWLWIDNVHVWRP